MQRSETPTDRRVSLPQLFRKPSYLHLDALLMTGNAGLVAFWVLNGDLSRWPWALISAGMVCAVWLNGLSVGRRLGRQDVQSILVGLLSNDEPRSVTPKEVDPLIEEVERIAQNAFDHLDPPHS